MDRVRQNKISIFLGLIFSWLSIELLGIGAVVSLPPALSLLIGDLPQILALVVLEMIGSTYLVAVLLVFIFIKRFVFGEKTGLSNVFLIIPFFIQQTYLFITLGLFSGMDPSIALLSLLPKLLIVGLCAWLFSSKTESEPESLPG